MATATDEKSTLKEILNNLDCPFTWKIDGAIVSQRKYIPLIVDQRMNNCLEDLIVSLMICYELVLNNDVDNAKKKMENSETILSNIKNQNSTDTADIMRAIEHVVKSTKCHLYYKENILEDTKHILESITDKADLNKKEVAALYGCQSVAWSTYFEYGREVAIELATKAIKDDPQNALWHFTLGKNIRGIRRNTLISFPPAKQECECFEKAHKMSKNPKFYMFYAQMLREKNWNSQNKELEDRLIDIYKEILNSETEKHNLLLRLALGFLRIKSTDQSELAKKCLDMYESSEEEIFKDPMYLHYRGLYYRKLRNKTETLRYFKAAAELNNFAAEMEYVAYGATYNMVDPVMHLQQMLVKYSTVPSNRQQNMLLAIATSYYIRHDIETAAEYYLKAVEVDPEAVQLTKFYMFASFKTQSIYGFLQRKLLNELKGIYGGSYSPSETYMKLRKYCQEHNSREMAKVQTKFQECWRRK